MKRKGNKQRGRRVDSRNVFVRTLIVTEGTRTEPDYFRHFTDRLSKVVVFGEGKSTVALVNKALAIPELEDYDRVWVVFDKDENTDFNDAIVLAETHGLNVAWSNEAFELWLYLHFQYLSTAVSRAQYPQMLEREIGRFVKGFKYAKNESVYDILQRFGNENLAVENARKLCALNDDSDYAARNPCTTVHLLVEELRNPEKILEAKREE